MANLRYSTNKVRLLSCNLYDFKRIEFLTNVKVGSIVVKTAYCGLETAFM